MEIIFSDKIVAGGPDSYREATAMAAVAVPTNRKLKEDKVYYKIVVLSWAAV